MVTVRVQFAGVIAHARRNANAEPHGRTAAMPVSYGGTAVTQIGWLPLNSAIMLDGLKSLILLVSLVITRALIVRWIFRNPNLSIESKRRWVVTTRNSIVFAFVVGLVVIWAHELQAFAVSIVALAAALVLATKELILCWSGAALRGWWKSLCGGRPHSNRRTPWSGVGPRHVRDQAVGDRSGTVRPFVYRAGDNFPEQPPVYEWPK
jgi:hypothetical protein